MAILISSILRNKLTRITNKYKEFLQLPANSDFESKDNRGGCFRGALRAFGLFFVMMVR
jgi:hypothetical protein